jgi:PleD family two-component response regulator
MKVLLIDDDDASSQLISNLITRDLGTDITIVSSGEEALLTVVSHSTGFDLILLDILMPGVNGIETCLKIRELEAYENVPIIFISASNESDHLLNAFYAGGADFIKKPVDKIYLNNRILLALKNSKERSEFRQTIKRQDELIEKLNNSFEQLIGRIPFDSDTNLLSQAYITELIQKEWLRHKRSQMALALVLIRIEGMSSESKKEIAAALEATCRRAADHLGLWSETCFAAILVDGKENSFHRFADKILEALMPFTQIQVYVGLSACIPPINAGQSHDLVEGAQTALTEAKKKGAGSTNFKEVIFSHQTQKVG